MPELKPRLSSFCVQSQIALVSTARAQAALVHGPGISKFACVCISLKQGRKYVCASMENLECTNVSTLVNTWYTHNKM